MLGFAGLIPFAALAAAAHFGAPDWIDRLLVGYALVILGFLCGGLWLGAVESEADRPEALVVSNVLVLAGMVALVLPVGAGAAWLAALFALQFAAERYWIAGTQPGWYRRLRALLSAIAVVLLALAGMAALLPDSGA